MPRAGIDEAIARADTRTTSDVTRELAMPK
jgi:hypothetical protein